MEADATWSIFLTLYGMIAFLLYQTAAAWVLFRKAGEPGWAILVPIYNVIVALRIAGKPAWWLILLFLPVISFVFSILTILGLADNFGRDVGFKLGLCFLPFLFIPILAFNDYEFEGAGA